MAMWSDVELLTNEDTNTVRLSSVSKEEHASGLYQVDTLVKISTATEVTIYLLTFIRWTSMSCLVTVSNFIFLYM